MNAPFDGAVIELRQYSLHAGQRDTLVALFEREFIATQEACGIKLLGLFHDLDRPERFVWLRGFTDMPRRAQALADFYGGPAWRAHREAANATMVDSDDVRLLRPLGPGLDRRAPALPGGLFVVGICPLTAAPAAGLREALSGRLQAQGAELLACWDSEPGPNNFPRLSVREGEPVLVWLARHQAGLDDAGRERLLAVLRPLLPAEAELLRLSPTRRSALQV